MQCECVPSRDQRNARRIHVSSFHLKYMAFCRAFFHLCTAAAAADNNNQFPIVGQVYVNVKSLAKCIRTNVQCAVARTTVNRKTLGLQVYNAAVCTDHTRRSRHCRYRPCSANRVHRPHSIIHWCKRPIITSANHCSFISVT